MHNFKELRVWQESMLLAKATFGVTKQFPKEEKYGLISQMNRAAVSVPSNIAEGASRDSKKEFRHFLNFSLGSCFELETQLILANSFGYVSDPDNITLAASIIKIQKMISKLKSTLPDTYLLDT